MPRVKDIHANHKHSNFSHFEEGLADNLVQFNRELLEYFPEITYTSGKRSASDKVGKASSKSRHNTGEAVDIVPDKKVYEFLTTDIRGLRLLNKYGLGALDETDPEVMKATGATGAHYHIGKDTKLVSQARKMIEDMEKNNRFQAEQGISNPNRVSEVEKGKEDYKLPDYMYSYLSQPLQKPDGDLVSMPEIAEDIETEEIREEKETQSENRKAVTSVENAKKTIEDLGLFSYLTDSEPVNQEGDNYRYQRAKIDIPDTPELQGLPSIFQLRNGGRFSTKGYKKDSPDKNNSFNIIDSNSITMENVDHPVVGIDDTGHIKIMMPEEDYTFPGNRVLEIPVKGF